MFDGAAALVLREDAGDLSTAAGAGGGRYDPLEIPLSGRRCGPRPTVDTALLERAREPSSLLGRVLGVGDTIDEIDALPELLALLALDRHIVPAEAMPCQLAATPDNWSVMVTIVSR